MSLQPIEPLVKKDAPAIGAGSSIAAPLASAGLIVVLLILTGFAVGVAFATHRAADKAKRASELSDKYEEARFAVSTEESLERKYRLEPGLEVRAEHQKAATTLVVALNSVRQTGNPQDRARVDRVLTMHAQYVEAVGRLFDAVDAHDLKQVSAIDDGEADPLFEQIEDAVNAASLAHHTEAIQRLNDLGKLEGVVFTATPVVFGAGLLLLAVFGSVLRGYRQRIAASNQREIQRINESAHAEIERLKLTVEAEQQVLRTNEALQARKLADDANTAKSEFLSRMSHELRTPLNAILGFGQLLEMGAQTADQAQSVGHILKGGRHLLDLINEVLDLARVEAGHLGVSLEPVCIAQMLGETLALIAPLAAPRGIQLRYDSTPGTPNWHVRADHQRLRQVLLNLISNAVKYNRDNGKVTLSCEFGLDDRLRINIADTGAGISASNLARLFTPFERLGAEGGDVEGTGLGLALSKRFIELMGGSIGVESQPAKGSVFWVELDLVGDPMRDLAQTKAPVHELDKIPLGADAKTVLYIEDNLSNLQLVEQIFHSRPKIRLLSAMQGSLGVDLARDHRPDLILLDLHLPDLRGDLVLARLRAEPATAAIPVVMISADATPGQIKRLLAAGADAYLSKPLDVGVFLRVLDEFLSDNKEGSDAAGRHLAGHHAPVLTALP